jgi:hypothetical protein
LVASLHRPDHPGKTRPGTDGLKRCPINPKLNFGAEARSVAALGQRALARWLEGAALAPSVWKRSHRFGGAHPCGDARIGGRASPGRGTRLRTETLTERQEKQKAALARRAFKKKHETVHLTLDS